MNFINEKFKDLNSLLEVISSRPNNEFMKRSHSSERKGDSEWYGTESWDEAVKLMKYGYSDILPDVRSKIDKNKKVYNQYFNLPRRMPENSPIGYIPNVPNAIRGLPNSMISIENKPQKRKTVSIIYITGGAAIEDKEYFIETGTAMCSAINIMELKGIQTKLDLAFMSTVEQDETVFPTVTIKDYNKKFDLQKICFPFVHPSMFRRIGFKYLETCPEITEDFSFGYGKSQQDIKYIKKSLKINDNSTFVISCSWIRDHHYDVLEILEYFKVEKEER